MIDGNDVSLPHHPFSAVFPLLEGPAFDRLVEDIRAHGLREPIRIDREGRILDGRNRERACRLAGVPVETRIHDGDDTLAFIIGLNLHRRHLNESQRAMVAARLALLEQGRPPEKPASLPDFSKASPTEPRLTQGEAAHLFNVGERNVRTARVIHDIGAPAVVAAVETGLVTVNDAVAVVDLPTKEQEALVDEIKAGTHRTLKRAAVARRHQVRETPPANRLPADRCRLFIASVADMTDRLEPGSIDCILTDPPYPREFLPVYADLAHTAAKVLKPGGSCLVMVGQSYLPEILATMTPHLRYHWTVAYLTPGGQSVQLWDRKVNTFWKPVLWFVNGGDGYAGNWIGDVARSAPNNNDKRFHSWGQSESGMADLMRRFTAAGETILDPFMGGGTTGVVALDLGRRFVGSDIDVAAVDTARSRLAMAQPRECQPAS